MKKSVNQESVEFEAYLKSSVLLAEKIELILSEYVDSRSKSIPETSEAESNLTKHSKKLEGTIEDSELKITLKDSLKDELAKILLKIKGISD